MTWDRFARKCVVTCPQYAGRHPALKQELKRVGMGSVDFVFTNPGPYSPDSYIDLTKVRHVGWLDRHPRHLNCLFGHYTAVKSSYDLGLSSVLIMEDDVRFLRDTDRIGEYVSSLPDDYGVAFFDVLNPVAQDPKSWSEDLVKSASGGLWGTSWKFRTAGCYALSREAMRHFVDMVEAPVISGTGFLRHTDNYWKKCYWPEGIKMLAAVGNVAVQRQFVGAESGSHIADQYKAIGVDVAEYGGDGE